MIEEDPVWHPGPSATTEAIQVDVETAYLAERSRPHSAHQLFAYRITIANHGREPIQLLNRTWQITDAYEQVEEVAGPGVVGQQPRLEPGEGFQYVSFCPLPTRFGSMRGQYEMRYDDGSRVNVVVPEFYLVVPGTVH